MMQKTKTLQDDNTRSAVTERSSTTIGRQRIKIIDNRIITVILIVAMTTTTTMTASIIRTVTTTSTTTSIGRLLPLREQQLQQQQQRGRRGLLVVAASTIMETTATPSPIRSSSSNFRCHNHHHHHNHQPLSSTFLLSRSSLSIGTTGPTAAAVRRNHHRTMTMMTLQNNNEYSGGDNGSDKKEEEEKNNKKKKKGNFITEFMRAFSASSPNNNGSGGGGGSYNLLIDYDELPFPGPEIGSWALQTTDSSSSSSTITPAKVQTYTDSNDSPSSFSSYPSMMPARSPSMPHLHLMTVAGGCFWGIQLLFDRVDGVEFSLVGYTQGRPSERRPNYDQVIAGATHHTEAVLVYYDPTVVTYESLIKDVFFKHIDPTTVNGQGRDYGKNYRTGIYAHTLEQEETARKILTDDIAPTLRRPIATEVRPSTIFWPAELYHQKYLERGGRFGVPQSAEKGSKETIRCYG